MEDGLLSYIGFMLARRAPMLLFALGAIIFSLIRWKRHPRVSLMVAIAFFIYLVDAFLFSIFNYYIPTIFRPMKLSPKGIDWLYFFVYFFRDFVFVIVIVLLVSAAFTQRKTTAAENTA